MSPRTLGAALTLAALLGSGSVRAQDEPYWFAGGALGLTQLDGYEFAELTPDVDDDPVGWRIFGGRRFGRHLAVAGSYVDLGTVTATGTLVQPGDLTDRVAVSALEVSIIGFWPIGRRIELFGVASALRWDQDVTTALDGQAVSASARGVSPGLGVGLNLLWRDDLFVTFDARRYVEVGDRGETGREHRRDLFTVGVTFRFGD